MARILIINTLFMLIISFSTVNAGTISPQLQSFILTKNSFEKIDIIIEFNATSTLPVQNIRRDIIQTLKNQNITSKAKIKLLLENNSIISKDLWIINSFAASIPAVLIPFIAAQKNVAMVRLDRKIVLDSTGSSGPPAQIDWNISIIGADKIWNQGILGEGVTIGSMDSGVDINHPDLLPSWRGGSNSWFDPYGGYTLPHDSNGHGTQTTSLIVGGNTSGYSIGVAPDAQWIAAKIFDDSNTATISAIHQSFQWMLDPDNDSNTDDGADIVNSSWNFGNSAGQCDYEFQNDISILRAADVAVVFSAGNSGPSPDTSLSPANNKDTIPVGAIDESLNVAFSSSRGPSACDVNDLYPQLSAPGINVYTADLTFGGVIPNSYTYSSGTSYAAPHVAGSLALLQSIYPESSLTDRETALINSALSMGSSNDFGAGIVDVDAALQYMLNVQNQNSNLKVNLSSPIGQIGGNSTPTFFWSSKSTATNYKLWIKDSTGSVNQLWYTPAEVNCANGESMCSINSVLPLDDGNYSWKVRARNTLGLGPWSTIENFIVGLAPTTVTPLSPIDNIGANSTPTFTWQAIPNATNYKLWVKESSSGVVNQVWYTPNETNCANGELTCSITPVSPINNGTHFWKVRARNIVGLGPWSERLTFFIGSPPSATTLISPSGSITSSTPTYFWNAVPNTVFYQMKVRDSSNTVVTNLQFTAIQAGCGNGEAVCNVTPSVSLSNDNYRWIVKTKNEAGHGPWSDQLEFDIQ